MSSSSHPRACLLLLALTLSCHSTARHDSTDPNAEPIARHSRENGTDAKPVELDMSARQLSDAAQAIKGDKAEKVRLANLALRAFLTRDEPYYVFKRNDLYSMLELSDDQKLVRLANQLYWDGIFSTPSSVVPSTALAAAGLTKEVAKPSGRNESVPEVPDPTGGTSRTSDPEPGNAPAATDKGAGAPAAGAGPTDLPTEIARREHMFDNMAVAERERNPQWLELLALQAQIFLQQGRVTEAQAKLRELLAAYSRLHDALVAAGKGRGLGKVRSTLGDLLLMTGDYQGAADVYSDGVDDGLGADSSNGTNSDDESRVDALAGRAAARQGQGNTAAASSDLDKAIELAARAGSPRLPYLKMMREFTLHGAAVGGGNGTTPASSREGQPPATERAAERLARLHGWMEYAARLQSNCSSLAEAVRPREEIVAELQDMGRAGSDLELVEARRDLAALLRVIGRLDEARKVEGQIAATSAPRR